MEETLYAMIWLSCPVPGTVSDPVPGYIREKLLAKFLAFLNPVPGSLTENDNLLTTKQITKRTSSITV